jgi:hypothetical protein
VAPECINLLNRAIGPFGFDRPPLAFTKHHAENRLLSDYTHSGIYLSRLKRVQGQYVALVKLKFRMSSIQVPVGRPLKRSILSLPILESGAQARLHDDAGLGFLLRAAQGVL